MFELKIICVYCCCANSCTFWSLKIISVLEQWRRIWQNQIHVVELWGDICLCHLTTPRPFLSWQGWKSTTNLFMINILRQMETTCIFPEIKILELGQLTWCFREREKKLCYFRINFVLLTYLWEGEKTPNWKWYAFQLTELSPSSAYRSVFCGPTEESVPFKKLQKINSDPYPAKVCRVACQQMTPSSKLRVTFGSQKHLLLLPALQLNLCSPF